MKLTEPGAVAVAPGGVPSTIGAVMATPPVVSEVMRLNSPVTWKTTVSVTCGVRRK